MKLGIIAGAGDLPIEIIQTAKDNNLTPYIITLKSYTDSNLYKDQIYTELSLGQVGKAINYFKKNNITHICFAGSIKRPNLTQIIPDLQGTILLSKILKAKILGDDNLLRIVIRFFEEQNFKIISASEIIHKDNIKIGSITEISPSIDNMSDIELGLKALDKLDELDVGQAVIASQGRILSIEGAEGTDQLIKRTKEYIQNQDAVLIKLPKKSQDKRIDMPTIGPVTIEELSDAGIKGVAISSEVIILSEKETIAKANSKAIFIHILK
jgi:DUF1009 family protein